MFLKLIGRFFLFFFFLFWFFFLPAYCHWPKQLHSSTNSDCKDKNDEHLSHWFKKKRRFIAFYTCYSYSEYTKFAGLAGHVRRIFKMSAKEFHLAGERFDIRQGEDSKCLTKDCRFARQNVLRGSNEFCVLWAIKTIITFFPFYIHDIFTIIYTKDLVW